MFLQAFSKKAKDSSNTFKKSAQNTANIFAMEVKFVMERVKAKWVDIDGVESNIMFADSYKDILAYYDSIYDENQTGSLPPTITLPPNESNNRSICLKLNKASERAKSRTKEQLIAMSKKKKWSCV